MLFMNAVYSESGLKKIVCVGGGGGGGGKEGLAPFQGRQFNAVNLFLLHQ